MANPTPESTPELSRWQVWLLACRPKTLWAGVTPVVMGGAMALQAQEFHWLAFAAALAGALLIQIGTNFVNDFSDFLRESDTTDRIGPLRVTQAGLVSPTEMKRASGLVFGLAVVVGLYLVIHGGVAIMIIGVLSILFGILYTAGPYPLGYTGWADLFVLVFFGPVAVAGTYYVCTLDPVNGAIVAGLPAGMIATAILAVNNLRDYDTDKTAGKLTLAVRFGRRFARLEYLILLVGAGVFPMILLMLEPQRLGILLPMLTLIPGFIVIRKVMRLSGPPLNLVLAQTGQILAVYGLLFALGWNL